MFSLFTTIFLTFNPLPSTKAPFPDLRISPVPPISPLSPKNNRHNPIGTRLDANNTRYHAMTPGNQEMDLAPPTSMDPPLRMDNLLMSQLWGYLSTNNEQENGDVVLPAKLLQIMSALVISMQETSLRMTAMEDQLRKSAESTHCLEKLERQLTTLIDSTQG